MASSEIKVLQIITKLVVGGAQEHLMNLCDLLNHERYRVTVLSGAQTGPEGELIKEIERRRIDLSILPELVREINPLKDLLALIQLTRYIKKERFDIVHTNSSKAGILGRLAARLAGVPIVVHTVHGWGHHDQMGKLRRGFYVFLEKCAGKLTDKIITVSDLDTKKGLNHRIGDSGKYITIRSGIDLNVFNPTIIDVEHEKRKWGIPLTNNVVGSIMRFSEQKNPLDFVRMAAEIVEKSPRVSFLLVGDGNLRPQIENSILRHNLSEKIILTGVRHDVPQLLAVMDVFVLPSLWEGLPRVIPQAMAMGLPIVATEVGGTPEAIEENQNGFLVTPKDFHAIARKVIQLLEDHNMARKMGERGRKMVYPEFCIKQMVKRTENLYEELARSKQKSLPGQERKSSENLVPRGL